MSKKTKILFGNIPFDCWTEVISFFHNPRDFLSVCLTVRGLFNYICDLASKSTQNIRFLMKRIPKGPRKFVSSVGVDKNTKNFDKYLTKLSGNDEDVKTIEDLLVKFQEVLPKVGNMSIRFCYAWGGGFTEGNMIPTKWTLKKLSFPHFPQLRVLRLTISLCEIKICETSSHHSMPNLEELRLFSETLKGKYFQRLTLDELFSRQNLFIDFSLLPRLKILDLCGYDLKTSHNVTSMKETLKEIVLENTIPHEKTIVGFSKLEFLALRCYSISEISKLSDLPNLRKLEINPMKKLKVGSHTYSDDLLRFSINFGIENLPNLEEIIMEEEQMDFSVAFANADAHTKGQKYEFSNLPNLRKVKFHVENYLDTQFDHCLSFCNTPSLEYLSLVMDYEDGDERYTLANVDFVQESDLLNLEYIKIRNFRLGKNTVSHFGSLRKLRTVDLCFSVWNADQNEATAPEHHKIFAPCLEINSPSLESLVLGDPYSTTMYYNERNFPLLQKLDVEVLITDGTKEKTTLDNFFQQIGVYCPSLKKVLCRRRGVEQKEEHEETEIEADCFPELEELILLGFKGVKIISRKIHRGGAVKSKLRTIMVDGGTMKIQGLENLENVEWGDDVDLQDYRLYDRNSNDWKEVAIQDCPKLKSIRIGQSSINGDPRKQKIVLKNLDSCVDLKLKNMFLREEFVHLSALKRIQLKHDIYHRPVFDYPELTICPESFPEMEEISFREVTLPEKYSGESRIKMISGLTKLKKIVMRGCVVFDLPFTDLVRRINLDEVFVEGNMWTTDNGVKKACNRMTLRDFVEFIKNEKGIEVQTEEC